MKLLTPTLMATAIAPVLANAHSRNLTVPTTSGTFTGFVNASVPNVEQWLGIPFGTPPVGGKRFMPAEPAPYGGHADAKSYKPICRQNGGPGGGIFWDLVPEFQNTDPQDEDCLYLNIWGPKSPKGSSGQELAAKEKVPVIIWVCGGGFQEGGGHAPYQVPDHWIERTQTHIVVTFNYRLSVWGFPGASAAPVNAGFTDIRLVVEWLRGNIAGFGGDPERMILWGQSAGGNAVDSYSYANPSDPIVAGLIASSGTAPQSASANTSAFTTLASNFGCGGLDAEEELECMQAVDSDELHSVIREGGQGVPRFGPAADGVTLFENNTARAEAGLVAKVPLIVGNTINEGAAFAPESPNYETPPDPEMLKQMLGAFACPVEAEVDIRVKYGLPTYRYLFAGNFSNVTPRPWLGAMHSSDIPLVFGTHWEFRGNSTELEWQTSFAMESLWYSLAANSSADPSDGVSLTWPEYSSEPSMVLFGDENGAQLVPGDYYDEVYQCDQGPSR